MLRPSIRAALSASFTSFWNSVHCRGPSPDDSETADPDDDHVLACAIAAQADLIVSGDSHLLDLKSYQGIFILDSAQTLQRIVPR